MARRVRTANTGGTGNGRIIDEGDSGAAIQPTNLAAGNPAADDSEIDGADYIVAEPDDAVSPDAIDAETGSGNGSDSGTRPGRRGRKPGSKNRAKTATQATVTLERILFSLHIGAGLLLSAPELSLTHEESALLAEAVTGVTQCYDIPLMDEKTMAWMNLLAVGGMVYGPRIGGMFFKRQRLTVVSRPPAQAQPIRPTPTQAPPKPNGEAKINWDFVPATGGGVSSIENA